MNTRPMRFAMVLGVFVAATAIAQTMDYAWSGPLDPAQTIAARISPPDGYARADVARGSFGDWLRHLPLHKGIPPVRLHDGRTKTPAGVHVAVVDIDVGKKDLQQCADAVIRLRAEYLWQTDERETIAFDFTSGDRASWSAWAGGWRPVVSGSRVRWQKNSAPDASRLQFRKYLTRVFVYAGSISLQRELTPVNDVRQIAIGDVFVQGGSPGHAVIVVDVAEHAETKAEVFLLAQSYMPAQEIHILKNPADATLSPWYAADFGETLVTPEWRFSAGDLRRFIDR